MEEPAFSIHVEAGQRKKGGNPMNTDTVRTEGKFDPSQMIKFPNAYVWNEQQNQLLMNQIYTCTKRDECVDKWNYKEACLLASALGSTIVSEQGSHSRTVRRAVMDAYFYEDAGVVFGVDVEGLLKKLDRLTELQALSLIAVVRELFLDLQQQKDIAETVKKHFYSMFS